LGLVLTFAASATSPAAITSATSGFFASLARLPAWSRSALGNLMPLKYLEDFLSFFAAMSRLSGSS
jgi:hypothetical protein